MLAVAIPPPCEYQAHGKDGGKDKRQDRFEDSDPNGQGAQFDERDGYY
jgi:hypothetical protein